MKHKEINQQTLVQLFKDAYDSEGIRLCFLLGAGASVSSSTQALGRVLQYYKIN